MKIYFTEQNKKKFAEYCEQIVSSHWWSDGPMTKRFEEECECSFGLFSVAVSNCGAALSLLFQYAGVKDKEVIIPANTFWATAIAAKREGARVIYADCNRADLCLSYEDIKEKITKNTAAVVVVHIGGHIAFQIEKIAALCQEKNIALIEDCAHAHGASWNGKQPGSWGLGGAYSFYATKTMTTGEGGLLVTKDKDLAAWAKIQRDYGKLVVNGKITYPSLTGFNYRMSEFTAALGRIQLANLPEILEWKRTLARKYDGVFERRVRYPEGMQSGYYKYIVFDYALTSQTGKVFQTSDHCHRIEGKKVSLPDCDWIGEHHSCVPIFNGWEHADKPVDELADLLIRKKER